MLTPAWAALRGSSRNGFASKISARQTGAAADDDALLTGRENQLSISILEQHHKKRLREPLSLM